MPSRLSHTNRVSSRLQIVNLLTHFSSSRYFVYFWFIINLKKNLPRHPPFLGDLKTKLSNIHKNKPISFLILRV
jgi:hypothetical protein